MSKGLSSKFSRILKEKSTALFSAFLPAFSFIIISLFRRLYPFGGQTLIQEKMLTLYRPLTQMFRQRIEQGNLFFSPSFSADSNFWLQMGYHGFNPLSGFLFFLPEGWLPVLVWMLFILRLMLSGFLMCRFLHKKCNLTPILSVGFSLFYSFGSLFLTSYQELSHGDLFWLLPLAAIGLWDLLDKKRNWLFSFALFCICLSSIPVMVTFMLTAPFVGLVLYDRWAQNRQRELQRSGGNGTPRNLLKDSVSTIGMQTFVGIFAAAVFWLPVLNFYVENEFPAILANQKEPIFSFSFFHFLRNMLFTENNGSMPSIHMGVFFVAAAILYFLNTEISGKSKLKSAAALLFIYFSTNIPLINRLWNYFSIDGNTGYKQSAYFFFLGIFLASVVFEKREHIHKNHIIGAFLGTAGLVIISRQLDPEFTGDWIPVLMMIMTVLYLCTLLAGKQKVSLKKEGQFLIIVILLVYETLIFGDGFFSELDKKGRLLSVDAVISAAADGSVRQGEISPDNLLLSKSERVFTRKTTPALEPLLGESVLNSGVFFAGWVEYEEGALEEESYENDNEKKEARRAQVLLERSPFYQTNRIYESLMLPTPYEPGQVEILSGLNMVTRSASDFTMEVVGQDTVFTVKATPAAVDEEFFFFIDTTQNVTLELPPEEGSGSPLVIENAGGKMISLGWPQEGDFLEISGTIPFAREEHIAFYAGTFHEYAAEEAGQYIAEYGFFPKSNVKSGLPLTETLEMQEDSMLVFLLPYSAGWKMEIDGNPVVAEEYNSLIRVPVPVGQHTLHLSYRMPGFFPGMALSCLSVLGIVILEIKEKKLAKKKKAHKKI